MRWGKGIQDYEIVFHSVTLIFIIYIPVAGYHLQDFHQMAVQSTLLLQNEFP